MATEKYLKRLVREARSRSNGRTVYGEELINDIIGLLNAKDYTVEELGKRLKINSNVLRRWVQKSQQDRSKVMPVKITSSSPVIKPCDFKITIEKERGLKVHVTATDRKFLMDLVRDI